MQAKKSIYKFLSICFATITALIIVVMFTSCNNNTISAIQEFPNTVAENAKIVDKYNEISQNLSKAAINEFKEIAKIPRKSGNMEGIRNYILTWAKNNKLDAVLDPSGCIYIDLAATPGQENKKSTIIQSHMDMVVTVASDNTNFDSAQSPIDLVYDEQTGEIHSKDYKTNIGADNGQGLGLSLALAKHTNDFQHGPIRLLFTYDEETTFEGAKKLDASVLNSDYFINFDTSRVGVCRNGCAGDFSINFDKKYVAVAPTEKNASENLNIKLDGLKGGHSGMDIALPRACASSIITSYLNEMKEKVVHFRLVSIDCGTAFNAIPNSFTLTLNINKKNGEEAKHIFDEVAEKFKKEKTDDTNFNYQFSINNATGNFPSKQDSEKILDVLNCIPNGVIDMSSNNTVKTSCNLGIIKLNEGKLHCTALFRSSDNDVLKDQANEITETLKTKKIDLTISEADKDPAWNPADTELSKLYTKAMNECANLSPTVVASHTSLEPSVFVEKKPGLQCISIGGDVKDEHALTETWYTKSFPVSVASVLYILDNI